MSYTALGGIRLRSDSASVSPHVLVIAVNSAANVFYIDADRYDSNYTKRPSFLWGFLGELTSRV